MKRSHPNHDAITPYRKPATPRVPGPVPDELAYTPIWEARADMGSMAWRVRLLLVVLLGVGAWVAGAVGGLVGLLVGMIFVIREARAKRTPAAATLRVKSGVVTVWLATGASERMRLDDVADVVLDVKTIERVMEGGSAIPAVRFIDSKVGPKLDTARIVLVSGTGDEIRLTEDYTPNFDATEWLGKVRVFLRKHGWVPEAERPGFEEEGVDA